MAMGTLSRRNRIWWIAAIVILCLSPIALPRFYVYLFSIILLFGLLATSNDFPLGFGGIYQFHHAVFYGVGAYGTALTIMKSGLSPWLAFIIGPLIAAFLSLVMGIICIRLSKLYFGMLQISVGSLVWVVVYRWYSFTGGDNGIYDITVPDILSSYQGAYYFTLIITGISLYLMYRILKSPYGSVLQGIRDNPVRSAMMGINVKRHQLLALIIAGFFAGVAGTLFVVVDNTVFPDMLFWTFSLEATIMCLLGGWLTFLGPLLGAAIIVVIRTFASTYTVYWGLVLSIIFVLVIFFLPNGILGWIQELYQRRTKLAEVKE